MSFSMALMFLSASNSIWTSEEACRLELEKGNSVEEVKQLRAPYSEIKSMLTTHSMNTRYLFDIDVGGGDL